LQAPPSRDELETFLDAESPIQVLWAKRQMDLLEKYGALPSHAGVLVQGVRLGKDVRLIAVEGEPVASHGHAILNAWPDGVTFPLGYANGQALYLPNSKMIDEGGMEVTSYWEYGFPAPLAKGMETVLADAVQQLKDQGI
jgi:hypothetical protein